MLMALRALKLSAECFVGSRSLPGRRPKRCSSGCAGSSGSPDDQYEEHDEWTLRQVLEARWNAALDHPYGRPPSRDPWSDEPPF